MFTMNSTDELKAMLKGWKASKHPMAKVYVKAIQVELKVRRG